MTTFRHRILAFAALAALALASGHAQAATQVLCSPEQSSGAQARTVTNPVTTTSYSLNGQGCALIAQADVGYFQSQGFTPGSAHQSFLFTSGVLTGTTAVQMPSLPANAFIREIIVNNTTANAVTGGIDIGTTSGAADVVSALTCGANCLTFVADAALLKRVFSTTAQQALFVVGHTAGNSANLNITVVFGFF